jgi:hypothetical protein
MELNTPIIFRSLNLRNREKYRDLSEHNFSPAEKIFACTEMCKESNYLDWPNGQKCSMGKFGGRYGIKKATLQNWKRVYEDPRNFFCERGRPKAVDDIAREEIIQTINSKAAERNAMPLENVKQLISKVVVDTKRRQGKRGADASPKISRNTRRRLLSDLKIRKLAPQILRDARRKACECIRISYIWGCLLLAYCGHLLAEQKWNADATTIIVSESLTGSLVCAILDVASSTIPDNLNILVKWFGLNNAGGESGPLVLVFAVPFMEEGTFFATQVLSLASTSAIGEKGWVYFSKTRGGTAEMWIHYYLNVTIPTIRQSNACHMHKVSCKLFIIPIHLWK